MSIEIVQAKRTVLVAQRDQLMAQFNMTNGAVLACDELIAEMLVEASKAKAAEAELRAAWQEKQTLSQPGSNAHSSGIGYAPVEREVEPATADNGHHWLDAPAGMTPPKPPAMHSQVQDFEAAANVDGPEL